MSTLAGKRALITHAGNGLEFAIAIALAQQNAELVVHEKSAAIAAVAVERLALAIPGIKVTAVVSDLAMESGMQQLLDAAGRIDIFVSDAVGEGATDFSQVLRAQNKGLEAAAIQNMEELAAMFAQSMNRQGGGRIFLLAPTPFEALTDRGHAPQLLPHELEQQATSVGVKAFRLPIANLMLEPVADVMKSEVMRTGSSLAAVADQIERDHRPLDIQKAAREISLLTQLITQACLN